MIVVLDQVIRFFRAAASGRIKSKGTGLRMFLPVFKNGREQSPCELHGVAADEQSLVAEHTVQQKPFVGFRHAFAFFQNAGIFEVHCQVAHTELRSRFLGEKTQGQSFLRLDCERQAVLHKIFGMDRQENGMRNVLECDDDLTAFCRKPFPASQIKGNPLPAPVVYQELRGNVSFGL